MPIYQIALPLPKRQVFDYLCEQADLVPGVRVVVPFGPREMVGVIVNAVTESEHQTKLKAIKRVLDESPVLDEALLAISHWLAHYYQHPIGEVMQTVMPVALRKGESDKPKPTCVLGLSNSDVDELISQVSRAKKQTELVQMLTAGPVALSEVKQQFSMAVINALLEKGIVEKHEVEVSSDVLSWSVPESLDKPRANVQQALAITAITHRLDRFACFLLEGITGSGKTEVYLQSIEEVLRQQRQVLILVPEIGLTPQTVKRFERRFGLAVGVLHSNLTDNERLNVWQRSRSGELAIVIGTRSSIFTPMLKPGMIIVDEEHDGSYKQQDGLKYNARDLAVILAKHYQVPLVLGTATPSLETLNNALTGKYQHLQLLQRAGNAALAKQQLMDITNQSLESGIATGMLERLQAHLEQGSQVMIFVNRRGFAPALLCHHCGFVEQCKRCNKPYTVHKSLHKIQCHHCGAAKAIPPKCNECGHHEMVTHGVGTEQLEALLKKRFAQYSTVRIDSDSVRGKSKLHTLLDEVNRGQHQILIGTQILSKGHHFPNVTLVVILDADGALFSADFRAAEHLAQLITQLAGRAGRAEKPGEMWLQTHQPGHPLLQDLIHNGYGDFARFALQERKLADLPPFCYQGLFRAEALQASDAFQFLSTVAELLTIENVRIMGPLPAIMEKRQGRYRMQLLLSSPSRAQLNRAIANHIVSIENLPAGRKVRWSIDIDPQDFL
ncbi:primosomal protein N' [Aliiglaciecola litoralis]|uniref:Replication restart protein PriA n=1 Tax=Aliiglaciecola litoralis TaxID=582857 RepID=A0ABP3WS06_9ALTE